MKKNSHEELRHQKSRYYYLFYCWWTQKSASALPYATVGMNHHHVFVKNEWVVFHSLHNRKQDKADTRPLAQQRALCLIPHPSNRESLLSNILSIGRRRPFFWLCCCYFYFLDTLRRLNNDEMMGVVKKSAAEHQRNIFSLKNKKKKE